MERTTFSLLFYIRRTKLNKEGEAPVFMRVTVNGQRADASVKRFIAPRLWNTAKGKAVENGRGCRELNLYLDAVSANILRARRNLEWTKALFTLRPYKFTGELTSTEFQRPFHAQDAILQFRPDKDGPGGFRFTIDGKDDGEWFRQQRNDAIKRITGIDVERNLKIKRGI